MQLLTFVVGSTLKGEADHLKETTIGVSVFGRSPDYDPKADTDHMLARNRRKEGN